MHTAKLVCQSLLAAFGVVWLLFEAYYGLTDVTPENRISFFLFLGLSLVLGASWYAIDGFLFAGHLKRSIIIRSNAFDTLVKVFFGDVFAQDGWKAISVNEFFDSAVDGKHIAPNSLHGKMLTRYWGGNIRDWDAQVAHSLENVGPEEVLADRSGPGKATRYAIGTTANASIDGSQFLCVALARTDITTLQASATSGDLNTAIRGLLCKARRDCSGAALNIPLMGSGLARTGIKPNIIVDLILLAVFEESKRQKITDEIRIVLPETMRTRIALSTIQQDWN